MDCCAAAAVGAAAVAVLVRTVGHFWGRMHGCMHLPNQFKGPRILGVGVRLSLDLCAACIVAAAT